MINYRDTLRSQNFDSIFSGPIQNHFSSMKTIFFNCKIFGNHSLFQCTCFKIVHTINNLNDIVYILYTNLDTENCIGTKDTISLIIDYCSTYQSNQNQHTESLFINLINHSCAYFEEIKYKKVQIKYFLKQMVIPTAKLMHEFF